MRALPLAAAALVLAGCSSHGSAADAGTHPPAGSAPATAPSANASSAAPASEAQAGERVVHVTAKKFEYSPSEIHLKKGQPVVLEFVSLDRKHGFEVPDLGLSTEIDPKAPSRLRFVPQKEGRFPFHCSVFCGDGHEDMTGLIVVDP
jgi:cytochrome c oxidase subunit 2